MTGGMVTIVLLTHITWVWIVAVCMVFFISLLHPWTELRCLKLMQVHVTAWRSPSFAVARTWPQAMTGSSMWFQWPSGNETWLENGPLISDFPSKTSIDRGFSTAMFDYQRVFASLNIFMGFVFSSFEIPQLCWLQKHGFPWHLASATVEVIPSAPSWSYDNPGLIKVASKW